MNISRFFRHNIVGPILLRRQFPKSLASALEERILHSESRHSAELRLVIEGGITHLPFQHCPLPRERAIAIFSDLRIWDTEENCGVLIYISLADRDVEIVADRGIARRVQQTIWEGICREIEGGFRENRIDEPLIHALETITELLENAYPPKDGDVNELPDTPIRI